MSKLGKYNFEIGEQKETAPIYFSKTFDPFDVSKLDPLTTQQLCDLLNNLTKRIQDLEKREEARQLAIIDKHYSK